MSSSNNKKENDFQFTHNELEFPSGLQRLLFDTIDVLF